LSLLFATAGERRSPQPSVQAADLKADIDAGFLRDLQRKPLVKYR